MRRLQAWLVGGLGVVAMALAAMGCSGSSPESTDAVSGPTSIERLVDSLSHARLRYDATEIDLGPRLARGTLIRGWSWREQWPGGGGGNWAVELEAEISFPLMTSGPRELTLWMGGLPDQGEPQRARIRINGQAVATLELPPQLAAHTFLAPAPVLHAGDNQMVIEFSRLSAPIEGRRLAGVLDKVLIKPADDEMRRRLRAVQLSWADIIVEADEPSSSASAASSRSPSAPVSSAPPASSRSADANVIRQPSDSELEFGLLPRPDAELRLETSSIGIGTTATIEACHDSPGGPECREVFRLASPAPQPEATWTETRIALPELESAPVSLRFRVVGAPATTDPTLWPSQLWRDPQVLSSGPAVGLRLTEVGDASRVHLSVQASDDPVDLAAPPTQGRGLGVDGVVEVSPLAPLSAPESEPGGGRASAPGAPPPIRHVLVYLIDTLRADLLIDPALDLPNLQRLLRHSQWQVQAFSSSSWTKPATGTLFTSLEPSAHEAIGRTSVLRQDVTTLAFWLEAHGIAAGAVVANGNVSTEFGFARGFRRYEHVYDLAPAVHRAALDWLRSVGQQPTFTYLHLLDPHYPYVPVPPWSHLLDLDRYTGSFDGSNDTLQALRHHVLDAGPEDQRHIKSLYHVKVRQLDAALGDLLDGLRELGMLDSTAIVLVSDHGEEFGEHGGWMHGSNLEPPQAQILLAVHRPGQRDGRVAPDLVSIQDVGPTVCALFGLDPPPEFRGTSLLAASPPPRGPVLLELDVDEFERLGLTGPTWAFSFSPGVNAEPRLFARLNDPGHRRNLASRFPIAVEALEQWCLRLRPELSQRAGARTVDPSELPPETLEQLRALGYIER